MLLSLNKKSGTPMFRMGVLACVLQLTANLIYCTNLDYLISTYTVPPGFVPILTLSMAVINAVVRIIVATMCLQLMMAFYAKTNLPVWYAWLGLYSATVITRLITIVYSFLAYYPFCIGIYPGTNYNINPEFGNLQMAFIINNFFDAAYIFGSTVVFLLHIVNSLDIKSHQLVSDLVIKYGFLKFMMLLITRFFALAINIMVKLGGVSNAITSMNLATQAIANPLSIYVVIQTAFFTSVDMVSRRSSMRESKVTSKVVNRTVDKKDLSGEKESK
ncbi:hypothetical protein EDD86DRAFT_212938 [Gorgonomyces haynaldii]|nr:hypothetical protein EDD86DRAFT_212938 [Gorgonomyces haynaldii]